MSVVEPNRLDSIIVQLVRYRQGVLPITSCCCIVMIVHAQNIIGLVRIFANCMGLHQLGLLTLNLEIVFKIQVS